MMNDQNPFETIVDLKIQIKNLEQDIGDLCFLIEELIAVLKFYSNQPNGHMASEITRYVTEGGH